MCPGTCGKAGRLELLRLLPHLPHFGHEQVRIIQNTGLGGAAQVTAHARGFAAAIAVKADPKSHITKHHIGQGAEADGNQARACRKDELRDQGRYHQPHDHPDGRQHDLLGRHRVPSPLDGRDQLHGAADDGTGKGKAHGGADQAQSRIQRDRRIGGFERIPAGKQR